MKLRLLAAFAAVVTCISFAGVAQATPLGVSRAAVQAGTSENGIQTVHYQRSRSCRWYDGERHCSYRHRSHARSSTGIYLNFGGRRRHNRDWDRNDHVDNNLNWKQRQRRYQ